MPKTVGVAVSNATFHFDKLYTYAVMPDQQDTVRLGKKYSPEIRVSLISISFSPYSALPKHWSRYAVSAGTVISMPLLSSQSNSLWVSRSSA